MATGKACFYQDRSIALPPLIEGTLIKRYKRFLADVQLEDGCVVTAHCPNSGSMKTCSKPGGRVWISKSDNPKRKLKYSWELIDAGDSLVGINTLTPNRLVKKCVENGIIDELTGYETVKPEVKTGEGTRLDLMLEKSSGQRCYIEIKNCTLVKNRVAMFPDAVTDRGRKHLEALAELSRQGHRTVIFFIIQRMDADVFSPAAHIDPEYARTLEETMACGVELMIRDTLIDTEKVMLNRAVPFDPSL
ncbi:MAG: DNA/RNA nuclease SfsA [Desulfarculaceae bacterium]|nr:DNA/RNA nuclease SfsA [Desulfarculaceae bacterium]